MRDKTAVEVAALKRKPGTHRVAPNLYLSVRPAKGGGLRSSWVFRYEVSEGGKRKGKNPGLGSTSVFTLAEARERARKHRQLLAEGIDPLQAKRDKATAAKLEAAKALTFGAAAKQLVDTHRLSWRNAKHRQQWATVFFGSSRQPPATALINDLGVQLIDTTLAMKVLEPIWQRTPETASRCRQRCEKVIDWATARGHRTGDNPFRWSGHLQELLPAKAKIRKVRHHPSLPYTELPAFMQTLRANGSLSAKALELCILTATRTSEVINATWNEVDVAAKLWSVPGDRMKSGKEHRVPLSDRVVEILEALPREDGTPFLFLGARKGRPLSDAAMREMLKALRPGLTVHGFRSTFRVWCAERTAFPHFICEAALAHVVHDAVEKAYLRSDVIEKRRALMTAWSVFCAQLPGQTANVVSLQKADAS
jgi:integrase